MHQKQRFWFFAMYWYLQSGWDFSVLKSLVPWQAVQAKVNQTTLTTDTGSSDLSKKAYSLPWWCFDILHLEMFKSWCEKPNKPELPLISFLLIQRVSGHIQNTIKRQKHTCLESKFRATWNSYKNIYGCLHK